jgi:hypothetical protein
MKLHALVLSSILLVSTAAGAQAQSLGDVAKKAAADKAAKAKAGRTEPATKTITNKDLRPDSGDLASKSTEPVTVGGDVKTQDALAALRAVESVLAGGANSSEFKRYYLEAKVKVDALPSTPDAAPLRAISNLYADAVTFSIAAQIERMSGSEVVALKARYATDYDVLGYLKKIPNDGIGPEMTRTERVVSTNAARAASQVLLILATEKLRAIGK